MFVLVLKRLILALVWIRLIISKLTILVLYSLWNWWQSRNKRKKTVIKIFWGLFILYWKWFLVLGQFLLRCYVKLRTKNFFHIYYLRLFRSYCILKYIVGIHSLYKTSLGYFIIRYEFFFNNKFVIVIDYYWAIRIYHEAIK